MKTSSAKGKGRRLQQWTRDQILETFEELEPDDVRSTSMGASGMDVQLSPAAQKLFGFAVECKNVESRLMFGKHLNSAEANAGHLEPMLVIKKNGKAPLSRSWIAEWLMERIGKLNQ